MTMEVDQKDIESATDEEIAHCPHFLQHQIKKSYELRVVVVGRKVMPFRIESQSSELTRVDWRKGTWANTFEKCDISYALESKILDFMDEMKLVTGSVDIIVDEEGNHWFLECNQDGAWAWLDNVCDGEVADEFAKYFIRRMADIDESQCERATRSAGGELAKIQ